MDTVEHQPMEVSRMKSDPKPSNISNKSSNKIAKTCILRATRIFRNQGHGTSETVGNTGDSVTSGKIKYV